MKNDTLGLTRHFQAGNYWNINHSNESEAAAKKAKSVYDFFPPFDDRTGSLSEWKKAAKKAGYSKLVTLDQKSHRTVTVKEYEL